MSIIFRRINQDQAPEAALIIVKAYIEAPWHEKWSVEGASARIAEMFTTPSWIGVGAFDGEGLCGFAVGIPHTAAAGCTLYIPEIAVLPDRQRKGIGKGLLNMLETEAQKRGLASVWLVSRQTGGAAEYYRAADYEQSTTLRVYSKPLK